MSEIEYKTIVTQREFVFRSIQILYDLSKEVETDRSKLGTFRSRYKHIDALRTDFIDLTMKVNSLKLAAKPDTVIDMKAVDSFDEIYYKIIVVADEVLVSKEPATADPRTSMNGDSSQPYTKKSAVRLPKLELPKFDGIIENWPTFFDTYSKLVHESTDISNIEKFHYLITCLSGSALAIAKGLPITADNYQVAFDALCDRFQNKRLIAATYLDRIYSYTPLKSLNLSELSKLTNTLFESVNALKAMKINNLGDYILFHLASRALDVDTRKRFEIQNKSEIPTFQELLDFLQNYVKVLETSEFKSSSQTVPSRPIQNTKVIQQRSNNNSKNRSSNFTTQNIDKNKFNACFCCGLPHSLYKCSTFLSLDSQGRRELVQNKNLCFNCLRPKHSVIECTSRTGCVTCGARHHTLLHKQIEASASPDTNEHVTQASTSAHFGQSRALVLLGTCTVRVTSPSGDSHSVRALIDSGAQDCFITAACAHRLSLPLRRCNLEVSGLGQNAVHHVKGVTTCDIQPRDSDEPRFNISPVVLNNITTRLPTAEISSSIRNYYKHLVLADNNFDKPADVELLLGAEIFHNIYDGQRLVPGPGLPVALHSVFGWVLTGKVDQCKIPQTNITSLVSSTLNLEDVVKKFWEVEEPPRARISVPEDDECEQLYSKLVYRNDDGRYVVPILLKQPSTYLGSSFNQAMKRFLNLERRLARHTQLKADYVNFMHEYEALGHMQPAEASSTQSHNVIPHHCVIRPESTTTKLRVVFDASNKTSNGWTLNDIVHTGPKLQADIVEILTKFRLHFVVFTADICKMYRMIQIRSEDRHCQHVLWRDSPSDPIVEYELNTVTYGVSSSPYLALRTLKQLAHDEGAKWPQAASLLCSDVFVDDVVTGAPSVGEALQLKDQVNQLLKSGQFELRKWSSNSPEFLDNIPSEHCQSPKIFCEDSNQTTLKILGVQWDPVGDYFTYAISDIVTVDCTKRSILSNVARIYDPVGWLTPMVLLAKLLLQDLWRNNVSWDEPVPRDIEQDWKKFALELNNLKLIRLPRLIVPSNAVEFQLVGFCDGSTKSYGCCVYLRAVSDNETQVHLLTAKSKVAPLKPLTVNRLELCSATLLARVLKHMFTLLSGKVNIRDVIAFTDSSCVLSWLHTEPHKLKTFVAHRVVQITDIVPASLWRHVSTHDNPADYCSRGLSCSQLAYCKLWWSGPPWLLDSQTHWPAGATVDHTVESQQSLLELKSLSHLSQSNDENESENSLSKLIEKKSSFNSLQRTVAWIMRFIYNTQVSMNTRNLSPLGTAEIERALKLLIRHVQTNAFSGEINHIQNNQTCNRSVQRLSPFLDSDGLIRVGGRLRNSNLPEATMHPFLLPKESRLSILIVDYFHRVYLHCGPRTLQSLIQRQFWILGIRNLIRSRLSKCIKCFKTKPVPCQPVMGDLPAYRFEQCRSFLNVGVDFSGSFTVKENRRRNARNYKVYVCLFVCLSVKAIHLELVTELSTEAFIAALDRFVSRRGLCKSILSDNGTNFVGAKRHLNEVCAMLAQEHTDVSNELTKRGITWRFNPPGGSHFGGIFESGIKSTKYHLKRVVGTQILTYEELSTILAKVEAILNSRPMCSPSSDPHEVDVITPGHFLIGGPLVSLPEQQMADARLPLRSRWQLLQKLTQSFWHVWQRDYLHTLQQKNKWFSSNDRILKEGDTVIILESNLPPLEWRLGRIEQIHVGKDNIARVVTVRTTKGTLCRPVVKICPLPY